MSDHIVVVGSLNQDLVLGLRRFPDLGETVTGRSLRTFCGGKGANQAFAAAKLGGRVSMVGQIGADAAGDAQLQSLRAVGVNVEHIVRIKNESTGMAVIAVEDGGENRIIVVPGANGSFTAAALAPSKLLLAEAGVLLVQLEVPLTTVTRAIEIAHQGGACVILDPAPAQDIPDSVLSQVNYVTPNLSELASLSGDRLVHDSDEGAIVAAARKLCARGVRTVIAKLGSRGLILVSARDFQFIQTLQVTAIDSTGAGDCFLGAFAAALMRGESELLACRFAAAAAAIAVTRHGAQASVPELAEVQQLLAANKAHEPDRERINA